MKTCNSDLMAFIFQNLLVHSKTKIRVCEFVLFCKFPYENQNKAEKYLEKMILHEILVPKSYFHVSLKFKQNTTKTKKEQPQNII